MSDYIKGQCYPELKGKEGTVFDINDNGAIMIIRFDRPDADEIEQFAAGKPFQIREIVLHDVMMLTARIGNLSIMDMPYHPNFSKNLSKINVPADYTDEGLALTLILVNGISGKIENMRLIGLGKDFTKYLLSDLIKLYTDNFDKNVTDSNIMINYNLMSPNQIYSLSKNKFLLK